VFAIEKFIRKEMNENPLSNPILTHGSLFSGIGGFDLAFERAGFKSLWQVELDDYANKVLEKHWPNVRRVRDVREAHGEGTCVQPFRGVLANPKKPGQLRAEQQENHSQSADWRSTDDAHTQGQGNCNRCLSTPTVLTGGFPCQPFSVAGKRRGEADDRHLWPEMFRIIREVAPRWVVAENVPGLVSIQQGVVFESVCSDLENAGYEVLPLTIPACAVNAPHRRERLWIVGYASKHDRWSLQGGYKTRRFNQPSENVADANRNGAERYKSEHRERSRVEQSGQWSTEPSVCELVDGLPAGLVRYAGRVAKGVPNRVQKLKALGNAIAPAVAEEIAWRIREADNENILSNPSA
jgi:DNA (cytosine-5)-methyltransferase 1